MVSGSKILLRITSSASRPPDKSPNLLPRKHLIQQAAEAVNFLLTNVNKDHAIIGEQIPGNDQSTVHEIQPNRMPVTVIFIEKNIVVNKVVVAGIIRGINFNTLDPPGMRHPQSTQGVIIIALN